MKKKIVVFIILISLIILGLWWLSLGILILVILYKVINIFLNKIKQSFIKSIIKGIFSFVMLLLVGIGIRVFVADIFLIPSSSMENTLYTNDVILVNKLKYGPNLPRSPYEIPWLNILYYLNDNSKEALKNKPWGYNRLSGTSQVKQGDVLVYKYLTKNEFFVKRCIAVAGDTLKIINGNIYTNENLKKDASLVKNKYRFFIKDIIQFDKEMDSLGLRSNLQSNIDVFGYQSINLSYKDLEQFEKLKSIDSIKRQIEVYNPKRKVFPWFKNKKWTLDNYGDIIVPKKGMKITLNSETYALYKRIIIVYEKAALKKKKDSYFIDGKLIKSYTFKQDYYFVMGDNRKNSHDSRYFGFLPEIKIVGKVQCVLFSYKDDMFQWNRLFKTL